QFAGGAREAGAAEFGSALRQGYSGGGMIVRSLSLLWSVIRSLSTDDAYDKYLAHHQTEHSGCAPLSRRAFYIRQQQHKWTGVSRCC
ncbi:MAG: YbdD/YjiX family protein, partial [Steroidobacter sp.]